MSEHHNQRPVRVAATSNEWTKRPRPRTTITDDAVDALAITMKAKLARHRAAIAGWDDPTQFSVELLAKMMAEALCTGEPAYAAAIAALLQARRADPKAVSEHAMRAFLQGSRDDQSTHIAALQNRVRVLQEQVRTLTAEAGA